jgi:hypothetical protein
MWLTIHSDYKLGREAKSDVLGVLVGRQEAARAHCGSGCALALFQVTKSSRFRLVESPKPDCACPFREKGCIACLCAPAGHFLR